MNKKEFLHELKKNLKSIKKEDREEIIRDYEEHFAVGKKQKRKESEIAESLGNPKDIAKNVKEELKDSLSVGGMAKDTFLNFWSKTREFAANVFSDTKEVFSKKNKEKEKPKEKTNKRGFVPRLLLTLFNLFIGVWIAFAFYLTIGTLLISSWAIVLTGVAMIAISITGFFVQIPYVSPEFLPLGIFAGLSITSMGVLMSIASWQLGKLFSKAISKYLKFNKKARLKNE
ncbi:MAG: DUF1700 domain-containing protein [Nanoarchaeota archaeon]|nr:DUF1700 domain-containing protein [Nanoarchaeota archaeon]